MALCFAQAEECAPFRIIGGKIMTGYQTKTLRASFQASYLGRQGQEKLVELLLGQKYTQKVRPAL